MTNELTPFEKTFDRLQIVAKNAHESGLYPMKKETIFMVLMSAMEMGIPPMEALNGGLWNIQGRIEISARLMAKMIRQRGHDFTIVSISNKGCVLRGKRADTKSEMVADFVEDDARAAGLLGKTTWKNYPEDMYYARALSRLGRRLFSDVIGTAYVEGEIRDALNLSNDECQVYDAPKQIENIPLNDIPQDVIEVRKRFDMINATLKDDEKLLLNGFIDAYCKKKGVTVLGALIELQDKEVFREFFDKYIDYLNKKKEEADKKAKAVEDFEKMYPVQN